ncbi:MAG TPA: LacI family DNA-binding transcriptional regulator [Bryobacteraceae bacterium]|nr:LacI family DNA-binding transcriptional regulator [Bryobacteraceae bacterium]
MATIKDVAKHARVSVGTVSNVLSESIPVSSVLRERVLAAIRKLDYHPNYVARSLKVNSTKTLGMVISDITNPFFPQVVRGAEDTAFKHGYLLITFNTDDQVERERQVLSVLRSRRVDGILLVVAPSGADIEHIRNTMQSGIPIVCLDRIPPGLAVDSVSVDSVKGAQVCVRHFINRGHRRIAIITGPLTLQTAKDRVEGYKAALLEAGIAPTPELIIEGDFRESGGYRLAKELLLRHDRPTAVFASNGMMALGLVRALEEVGLACPGDVAVASFDDMPLAAVFRPHLTAIAQPAYEIGCQGAELLIRRLQRKSVPRRHVTLRLEPELKIRESTADDHRTAGPTVLASMSS